MSSQTKVWAVAGSKSAMMVNGNGAFVVGTPKNFMVAHPGGLSLIGKSINLGTTSENIRVGGLWVWMNDFLKMIPSTIVTPIPSQIPWPPIGFASAIIRDIPFFIAIAVGSVAATALALAG